ncbi:ATP-binding cassette domain-containing protein, partial [Acinetobacter baumannii]
MLEVQGLHAYYGKSHILNDVSIDVAEGEIIALLGRNGAGKSTFLNAISGDLLVDTGKIEIDGTDVTRKQAWDRAGMVARVFQDPMAGTCEALTIEENMAL